MPAEFIVLFEDPNEPTGFRIAARIQKDKVAEGETALEEATTCGEGTYHALRLDSAIVKVARAKLELSDPAEAETPTGAAEAG